jgi:hypothetical protein
MTSPQTTKTWSINLVQTSPQLYAEWRAFPMFDRVSMRPENLARR